MKKSFFIIWGLALLVSLYITSVYHYLFFHSLAELFSIVVACGVFMLCWNSRRFLSNGYLLFLGIALLYVAGLDFLHMLSYKGMEIFRRHDTNLPTQLWICARGLESLCFLVAPVFFRRKLNVKIVFAVLSVLFFLVVVSISRGAFPVCFVEGRGLTPFKKMSEYAICLVLAAAAFVLYRNREALDKNIFRLLFASLIVTMGSETAFAFYTDVFGILNLSGHYLKILAFYLIYRAIIQTGLVKPYDMLFNDLKIEKDRLRANELRLQANVAVQQDELLYRQKALEAIYHIAIQRKKNIKGLCDQIVLSLAGLLKASHVSVRLRKGSAYRSISKIAAGKIVSEEIVAPPCGLCSRVIDTRGTYQVAGELGKDYPEASCCVNSPSSAYLGVLVGNPGNEASGVICVVDEKKRTFSENDVRQAEIYADYLSYEIEHERMEMELRTAQEMKLLGLLTSGVAHEVRNPLNAIMAVSEALFQRIGDNPEYNQYMVHIREQVNRLSVLMKDLLELGRPINKNNLAPVSVTSIIDGVIQSWQHSPLNGRCRVLRLHPSRARQWRVLADSGKLQQVFFNLLQNACQHSPENGEIRLEVRETGAYGLIIRVVDQGCGVPAEHLDRIFEPFFTTRKGGTGLGLSIVRHILEAHGGSITARNNAPLPGLTVEVTLPVSRSEREEG